MAIDNAKLDAALMSLPDPRPVMTLPKNHPYWKLNAEEKAAWRAKIGGAADAAKVVKAN